MLPHATWIKFIERPADIKELLQSTATLLSIRDLVVERVVATRNANVVKLTLLNTFANKAVNCIVYIRTRTLCRACILLAVSRYHYTRHQ